MGDYERPVDYSMPRQCGLYPPPPYEYSHIRAMIVFFQCPPDVKEKYLPPELDSDKSMDSIFIAEYPDTTIGPYNESLILLSCKHKRKIGSYVFSIYVDSDEALAAGREIWGYPKKFCEIKLSPIQNNKVQGTLNRKGMSILDVEVEIMDEAPQLDPNSKPALRQLTANLVDYGEFYEVLKVKTNYIKSQNSQYDLCYEILKDANKTIGGLYGEYDLTLPLGKVID
jgi:hypothetical protein